VHPSSKRIALCIYTAHRHDKNRCILLIHADSGKSFMSIQTRPDTAAAPVPTDHLSQENDAQMMRIDMTIDLRADSDGRVTTHGAEVLWISGGIDETRTMLVRGGAT
jgi:hypothetical protein